MPRDLRPLLFLVFVILLLYRERERNRRIVLRCSTYTARPLGNAIDVPSPYILRMMTSLPDNCTSFQMHNLPPSFLLPSNDTTPSTPFQRHHSNDTIPTTPFPRHHSNDTIPTTPSPRHHSNDDISPIPLSYYRDPALLSIC